MMTVPHRDHTAVKREKTAIVRFRHSKPVMLALAHGIIDPRISAIGGELLFEKRLEQWREQALASGQKFLQRLADGVRVPMAHVEEVMTVRRFISARSRAQELENRLKKLEDSLGSIAEISPINAEERRAISDNARLLRDQIDHEEGEHEAATRSVSELKQLISSRQSIGNDPNAMSDAELEKAVAALVPEKTEFQVLLRMARLHADWQAQCGRTPDFQAAVLSSVQLVAGTCVGMECRIMRTAPLRKRM